MKEQSIPPSVHLKSVSAPSGFKWHPYPIPTCNSTRFYLYRNYFTRPSVDNIYHIHAVNTEVKVCSCGLQNEACSSMFTKYCIKWTRNLHRGLQHRDLGVTLSLNLCWKNHCEHPAKRSNGNGPVACKQCVQSKMY